MGIVIACVVVFAIVSLVAMCSKAKYADEHMARMWEEEQMVCPYCGGKGKVMDCASDGEVTVRRHKCFECKQNYFTKEEDMDYQEGVALLREIKRQMYGK